MPKTAPECRKTRLRASILQKISQGGMPPDPPSMGRLRSSCLQQPCGLRPQTWKPPSSNPGSATACKWFKRPKVPVGREEQVRDAKWTRPSLLVEGLAPRLLYSSQSGAESLTFKTTSGYLRGCGSDHFPVRRASDSIVPCCLRYSSQSGEVV